MRILITGGFGYLGGRIAKSLDKSGCHVLLGSRFERSPPLWMSSSEVIKLDWNNLGDLVDVFNNIDVVIHAAGMNAKDCALNPSEAMQFNGFSTKKLINECINGNVGKFIYLSTAHVYQSQFKGNIVEETPLENMHPYATSNKAGEDAVLLASRNKMIEATILRLSNAVGTPTHQNANCWMLAVNDFCKQVVENREISVNSNRLIERDFFPISLLCETIKNIIFNKKNKVSILNVSSSKILTLERIVNLVSERSRLILGITPNVIFKNNNKLIDKYDFCISNTKLKEFINPKINLDEEVDSLLLNCKSWFS